MTQFLPNPSNYPTGPTWPIRSSNQTCMLKKPANTIEYGHFILTPTPQSFTKEAEIYIQHSHTQSCQRKKIDHHTLSTEEVRGMESRAGHALFVCLRTCVFEFSGGRIFSRLCFHALFWALNFMLLHSQSCADSFFALPMLILCLPLPFPFPPSLFPLLACSPLSLSLLLSSCVSPICLFPSISFLCLFMFVCSHLSLPSVSSPLSLSLCHFPSVSSPLSLPL
jgi:hypothetical protein